MESIYKIDKIEDLIKDNSYVGRGIIVGKSEDGKNAVIAYFIMGRSANSRNRIFAEKENNEVIIYPFDYSKVEDPSLIIYSPIREYKNNLIVTNGDQTDTIYNFLENSKSFEEALETREFEPDGPNFTPRISGILNFKDNNFTLWLTLYLESENFSFSSRLLKLSWISILLLWSLISNKMLLILKVYTTGFWSF